MSRPNLRVGDVVRCKASDGIPPDPFVARIYAIDENDICPIAVRPDGDPTGHDEFRVDEVKLLRRPVQLGDELSKPRNCEATGAVGGQFGTTTFIASELPYLKAGRWVIHNMWIDVGGITHADGTPIDPPVSRTAHEKSLELAKAWAEDARRAETLPAPTDDDHVEPGIVVTPPPTQRSGEGLSQLQQAARANEDCQRWYSQQAAAAMNARAMQHAAQHIDQRAQMQSSRSAEPPLTAEALARALWEVDPEVKAFVLRVSDLHAPSGARAKPEEQDLRFERALDRAWELDDPKRPGEKTGARTRWTRTAEAAVERLRGRR